MGVLLISHLSSLVTCHSLLVTRHSSLITRHSLLVTRHSSLVTTINTGNAQAYRVLQQKFRGNRTDLLTGW
jgi:hypothetical protein